MEMDYSNESKLSEFRKGRRRPMVFCVNCGSLAVEQTSVHTLDCLNCNNRLFWNGYRFSIARESYAEEDVASAIMAEQDFREKNRYSWDWHFNIFRALWQFSDAANGTTYMSSKEDPNFGKSGEEFEDLVRAWEECKAEIDGALSQTLAHRA